MVSTNATNTDPYHVVGSPGHVTDQARVLKSGDTFLVANSLGDVYERRLGEFGLYHCGTRHLSACRLRLAGRQPLLLSSSVLFDNTVLAVDMTNQDVFDSDGNVIVPDGTVHVLRRVVVEGACCRQHFAVTNHGQAQSTIRIRIEFGADFSDIFEVRGAKRPRRGERQPPQTAANAVELAYVGLDGIRRTTLLQFHPHPAALGENFVEFELSLGRGSQGAFELSATCQSSDGVAQPRFDVALERTLAAKRERRKFDCTIVSSNPSFNEWLDRSDSDLKMLVTETAHGRYPYAGVPWFSTVFGRDGIITALQTLWIDPRIARGVLSVLSAHQAEHFDQSTDAEPGKILHEMRAGEMANLREIPFGKYYGSVDSTPLFVMLASEYHRATGDIDFVRSIWRNLLRAMAWMEEVGDRDQDGFIEYGRRSKDGLVQQGWKDSSDSVFHSDGSPAEAPIALCEVQGYAYAAYLGMAQLAELMGQPELSSGWRRRAELLRERFDVSFWSDEHNCYALALDAQKRPCQVLSSNAAHCLYTGIVRPERAAPLIAQLMSPSVFSGWGIRTLASDEVRFNPMSYHNGSIWPHDNAIAASGFSRYGHRSEAVDVLSGMFDTASFMSGRRLPELFCGFTREVGKPPVRYPVACSPQAWASGAAFLLLQAALGVSVDGVARRVTLTQPILPSSVDALDVRHLPVGSASVDLQLRRRGLKVDVLVGDKRGDVDVNVNE